VNSTFTFLFCIVRIREKTWQAKLLSAARLTCTFLQGSSKYEEA